MCGILGLVGSPSGMTDSGIQGLLNTLRHRGPDDSGVWQDQSIGVLLGHTRLSILDLSPAGHQPMVSASGRYVVAFNGEIYNHLELREMLDGAITTRDATGWRGRADTETLLTAVERWGVETALSRCVGMFAWGLWDQHERTLHLARDRMGEKPLYYGYVGRAFAFASELKALRALPGFEAAIDRGAVALLMRYNCVPAPHSIYRGLAKLPPGGWLSISLDQVSSRMRPEPGSYWSPVARAEVGRAAALSFGSDEAAASALEEQIRTAVRGQMVADVPLGAFLSGGVDSSTVVALMQAEASTAGAGPVRTFSIGFDEGDYNEATHAKAVARHLGTDHTELYLKAQDALAVIPSLPEIYDEPFSDSSQIPTCLVAAMARRHVKVALSGDGGDEVFGGYNRHVMTSSSWPRAGKLPLVIRRRLAASVRAYSQGTWNSVARLIEPIIPERYRLAHPGHMLHKAADVLDSADGSELYRALVSQWCPEVPVLDAQEPLTLLDRPAPSLPTLTERIMALDAATYLPDDILTKVDRAAMAVSLETRAPLLDHRVYEFAWRLPLHYKVRNGIGKWLLRQVLYRHVPQEFIDRPKMGFSVPIDSWLRGPLRAWAEELLDETRLRREGFLDPAPIRQAWSEHLSGAGNWQYRLWVVLMFQAWLDRWR